jgi:8-oxo-dGTP pyrophosphatase MutT (NUDIX family)
MAVHRSLPGVPRPTHAALRLAHLGLRTWWAVARPHTRGVKVVLRRGDGQVLFVRHTYGDRALWELPGGGLRRRESPQDGAAREAREELGLDLAWRGLGLVETGGDGKTTTIHVFVAELPAGGAVDPDAGELADVRWAAPSAPPAPLGRDAPPVLGLL